MNSTFFPISSAADSLIPADASRSRVLAAALAWAVAQTQGLPAERPESIQDYFDANVERAVRVTLGDLNEAMVFDLRFALGVAKGLWMVRVCAAFPSVLVVQTASFFESAFGVHASLEPEQVALLNQYSETINRISRVAVETLATTVPAEAARTGLDD